MKIPAYFKMVELGHLICLMKHMYLWIFFFSKIQNMIHTELQFSIFSVSNRQFASSLGNSRSYFSKWDFEHLEKALFWIKRGKSLPLRQTRFRTSATSASSSFQQTVLAPFGRTDIFCAMKEAKQKPVIKASCPARCPLKRSWREDLVILMTFSTSVRAMLLSSFLFRFLAFFWSSSKTARYTSWDFLQFDSLLQKPWFYKNYTKQY